MVRGFYTLASGMLTQNRMLDTISNNLANSETAGYKTDHVTSKTFGSMVIDRVDANKTPIGSVTMMTTADRAVTDFTQGSLEPTGRDLDFAISGQGFFAVQTGSGVVYTRNGSFNVDTGGYLSLNGVGRVLGRDGQPIYLGTDDVTSDGAGNLSVSGRVAGSIGTYTFANDQTLKTVGEGVYSGTGATVVQNPQIVWKSIENSNTDPARELTYAIDAQRNLQSCSQALKMYDEVLDKATTDIGRI